VSVTSASGAVARRVFSWLGTFAFAGSMLAQTTPPTSPTALHATAANCGTVQLDWTAAIDTSGTGLKAYSIYRSDGFYISIAAGRTTFFDTNNVRSGSMLSYYLVAQDNAGNQSLPSGTAAVTTPACLLSSGEAVVDIASAEPLGKNIASYGARNVVLYQKQNAATGTQDTWIYVKDDDSGASARFVLHTQPAYRQIESEYLLASATELWTLSSDNGRGNLAINQYTLNGSPVSSATLVSSRALGDGYSSPQGLVRLRSGALVAAWNESGYNSIDLSTGFAYRGPSGTWSVQYPVTVPNSGGANITLSQMAIAQHPVDGSIWAFVKRDSFNNISALHFTEGAGGITLDWVNANYINYSNLDPNFSNDPEGEFPFLAAAADPTRNAILLAYQTFLDRSVFTDPIYGDGNMIFLKEAPATVAQIAPDGSKTFIPFNSYMERCEQFGLSVLSDGTIYLTYQPIQHQTLTWNAVYSSRYQNGSWSTPAQVGFNYKNYNIASGERYPGILSYRTDQAQVAFVTPDQKIHTFDLSNLAPAPGDTTAPVTSILSPAGGATVSGSITVSASATDNVGVSRVELWVDGVRAATTTTAPYNFIWNTTASANGSHAVQAQAYDAAGNVGASSTVTINVSNQAPPASLSVALTNPANGSMVPRNQKISITAAASGGSGVRQVQFYVDGALLGATTAAPYSYPWKVPAKRGAHTIKAQASDAAGNTAVQTISVTAQ